MRLFDVFRHFPTRWDEDPCANRFVCCPHCGLWSDIEVWGHCPQCGYEFNGMEDSQCGHYPPGWSDED